MTHDGSRAEEIDATLDTGDVDGIDDLTGFASLLHMDEGAPPARVEFVEALRAALIRVTPESESTKKASASSMGIVAFPLEPTRIDISSHRAARYLIAAAVMLVLVFPSGTFARDGMDAWVHPVVDMQSVGVATAVGLPRFAASNVGTVTPARASGR